MSPGRVVRSWEGASPCVLSSSASLPGIASLHVLCDTVLQVDLSRAGLKDHLLFWVWIPELGGLL